MIKILASTQENSINYAIEELKTLYNAENIVQLNQSIILAEINDNLKNIIFNISNNKPVFIRYIIPVLIEDNILQNSINHTSLEKLKLNQNNNYVLHFTLINNTNKLDKKEILQSILEYFKIKNININPKEANEIINITINKDKLYLCKLNIKDSLSSWNFGECKFRYEEEQISRAEFKLLEAIEYFNIDLKHYKKALDLGSAPGGWSRILLNNNIKVMAVDPADLDSRIVKNENLFHYKQVSQDFFASHKNEKYDIIVNDMKMCIENSVNLTIEASKYLNKNGIIIMTLKLNPDKELEEINKSIQMIQKNHKLVGVHQLFHNRTEATVVFKNIDNM